MTVSSIHQLSFFALNILAGLAVGAFYNLLVAAREEGSGSSAAALLADLLFWLAAGSAIVCMSLKFNDGGVRAYQILGAVCGFFLHYICLGGITMKIARFIVRVIAIILFPPAFLLRGAVLYIKQIAEKIKKLKIKIGQNIKRASSRGRTRKKIRKKYKKML